MAHNSWEETREACVQENPAKYSFLAHVPLRMAEEARAQREFTTHSFQQQNSQLGETPLEMYDYPHDAAHPLSPSGTHAQKRNLSNEFAETKNKRTCYDTTSPSPLRPPSNVHLHERVHDDVAHATTTSDSFNPSPERQHHQAALDAVAAQSLASDDDNVATSLPHESPFRATFASPWQDRQEARHHATEDSKHAGTDHQTPRRSLHFNQSAPSDAATQKTATHEKGEEGQHDAAPDAMQQDKRQHTADTAPNKVEQEADASAQQEQASRSQNQLQDAGFSHEHEDPSQERAEALVNTGQEEGKAVAAAAREEMIGDAAQGASVAFETNDGAGETQLPAGRRHSDTNDAGETQQVEHNLAEEAAACRQSLAERHEAGNGYQEEAHQSTAIYGTTDDRCQAHSEVDECVYEQSALQEQSPEYPDIHQLKDAIVANLPKGTLFRRWRHAASETEFQGTLLRTAPG